MQFFDKDQSSALSAKENAQWIAYAPVVFQATRALRNTGILQLIEQHKEGLTMAQVVEETKLPEYGVRVLLEAALGIGLLIIRDDVYKTTKTAWFVLHDDMTRVNMDFVQDVCYKGLFYLEDSIHTGKPEGLKVFGEFNTVYEALAQLPDQVRKSWFAFDHFYSDSVFQGILPLIFKNKPKSILDIGGNTGKWAKQCVGYNPDVVVTMMDLPGQLNTAKQQIADLPFADRIKFHEGNVLDENVIFPSNYDAVWLSQFLDCFSDEEITSILLRCKKSLLPDGKIYILEAFWDRQRYKASAFSLQQTSLYFTAIANGNSQMYHADVFIKAVKAAGLEVIEEVDDLGVSHTLLVCRPRPN